MAYPRPAPRTLLLAIVGSMISAVAIWLVVRDVDLARSGAILASATPLVLGFIVAVVAMQAAIRAARWRLLLPRGHDGKPIPLLRVAAAMLVGYLGNTLLPARLGEVVRSALIARRESLAPAEALGSAVLERMIDVLVLGALGAAAALAVAAPTWMVTAAVAGVVVAAAGVALAAAVGAASQRGHRLAPDPSGTFLLRVRRVLGQLTAGARVIDRPSTIAAAAALTLAAWFLDASVFWLAARALGLDLSPGGAMLMSAVAVLSTAVPTAPGYVGTFELAAVAAAGAAGIPAEPALALAVLVHLITIVPLSLAGAVSVWAMGGPSMRPSMAAPRATSRP